MIPHNRFVATPGECEAVQRVLASGYVGQGPEVEAFERELTERFERDAVLVSSGTAALYLALRVSGVWDNDRVLIPTYACSALYHAVRLTGAQVELGDVLPETFNLDPRVRPRHKVKATIYVHTYGVPGEVPITGVVISDVTHALGASFNGRSVVQMGDLAIASLGPTKLLRTPGAGVVFGPADRIAEIRDRRDYDGKGDLRERFNFQVSDVHASMGRVRLARLDKDLAKRERVAFLYGDVRGVPLQGEHAERLRVWYRYAIRVRDWLEAAARFSAAGIQAIPPLSEGELLHRQLGEDRRRFPVAEDVAAHALSLPIYPDMTDEEVSKVCEVLAGLEA